MTNTNRAREIAFDGEIASRNFKDDTLIELIVEALNEKDLRAEKLLEALKYYRDEAFSCAPNDEIGIDECRYLSGDIAKAAISEYERS